MMQENEIKTGALAPIDPNVAKKLRWLLTLATGLYLLGLIMPMMTISKLLIFKNTFSVLTGIFGLLQEGQIFLFVVVFTFTILLPILKIQILYKFIGKKALSSEKLNKYLHLMHEYGRWAMLDVMVVALLIVMVKLGAIASIKVHLGLFIFGMAVLMIMLITKKVVTLTSAANS